MLEAPAQRPWRDPRFEPVQVLGRGAGGVVYAAIDRETGGEVALKTFSERDPEALYRLKQEFRACAGVRHRNLVELYELQVDEHDCFFTMELVPGVDFVRHLRAGLADGARPSLIRFLAGAEQLVQGVAALHAAGRLHRDVKPPNALVTSGGRVVLLDFGFTVGFGERVLAVERSDGIAGSLAYMAPEILWGRAAGPASDWYSVGVVFYEALSGRLPFATSSAARVGDAPLQPPPLDGVPAILCELIDALLSPEPERRPDAPAIARAIATCSAEQRAKVPPTPVAEVLPFVGREAEIESLRAAAAELAAGTPSVVLICGASGIGKSELVRHFLAEVEQRDDAIVLSGRCHPYELVPYRAFDGVVDALSRALLGLDAAMVAALVPPHAATLVRLFPVLGRVPAIAAAAASERESGDAQEQRRRGFAALRAILRQLGERGPLLLWIDDVQWADPDSTALSRELFAGADAPRGLVVLSYRSDERRRAETFAAFDPGDGDGAVRRRLIELGPLSDDEARTLATRFAAGQTSDVSAAVRDAAGSPFLLGQLVRHHLTTPDAGRGLPDVIQARLAQLAAPARTLLEVIAVAGRPLEPNVALRSADLLRASRHELITLQEERLLRLAATSGTAVEVYHDRIRESLLAILSPAVLRERHRGLAHTLVREADPDPQALYRHFLGAGENAVAADWAAEAAGRADRVLAFAEAADLYEAAAKLHDAEGERHWTMQERRAGALVNAGRGAEAAPLFAATADRRTGAERLDLRRRAVEQLLQTGRMEEGTARLRELLRDVGLSYPRSTAGAAVPTLLRLTAIASRPGRLRSRRGAAVTPEARLRMDSSRCAAKGLVMVDPFRGMYFAVRTLALALRSGDGNAVVRELAEVGAALVPTGPPFAAWAGRLIDRARAAALAGDDPYLRGLTAITLAQKRMVEGRWRDMLALCDEGAKILREECAGVSWEVALAHVAGDRALEELGLMAELAARADVGLRRAESSGDMYGTVSALESLSIAWTAQGRFAEARAAIRLARRRWVPTGFQMQHLYMFRNEAHCDLAEEAADRVCAQLQEVWPQIVRSNLLRHALLKTDAHLLRARAAIALARDKTTDRAPLRQVAAADARVLEKQGRCDTVAHASLLRAAAAAQDGDAPAARALLESAAAQYEAAQMALMQAVAQIRLGGLMGGAPGVALARAARERLRQLTSVSAEIADVYAPGFPETDV